MNSGWRLLGLSEYYLNANKEFWNATQHHISWCKNAHGITAFLNTILLHTIGKLVMPPYTKLVHMGPFWNCIKRLSHLQNKHYNIKSLKNIILKSITIPITIPL